MSSPTRLYFGNLNPLARTADLRDHLIPYGEPANIWLAKNPAGFAFVDIVDREVAMQICSDLHNSEWMGNQIEVVEMVKPEETSDSYSDSD